MLLSVPEMERRRVSFDVTFQPGSVELSDSKFRQATALRIGGTAELVAGTEEVRIHGHISGDLEAECDRCLEVASLSIDRDFDLFYRPTRMDPEEPDVEIEASESEIGYYGGSGLQLADVLREQVLLWLPMQWVCDADCKGICPVCGGNRNRVRCGCRAEPVDDRWAALRGYRPPASR